FEHARAIEQQRRQAGRHAAGHLHQRIEVIKRRRADDQFHGVSAALMAIKLTRVFAAVSRLSKSQYSLGLCKSPPTGPIVSMLIRPNAASLLPSQAPPVSRHWT